MSAEQRIRGLCIVLLAVQTEEALLRLVPQLREAVQRFEKELKARSNHQRAQEKRSA